MFFFVVNNVIRLITASFSNIISVLLSILLRVKEKYKHCKKWCGSGSGLLGSPGSGNICNKIYLQHKLILQ